MSTATDFVNGLLRRCMLDALAHAAAPALAAAALAEADAEAVIAWLHANRDGRLKFRKDGFGPADVDRSPIIVSKDTDNGYIYLVRKETLAKVVPDQKRLDEALRVIAARGGLRPGVDEGKLTRQKRLSDGTKLRFLFFVPAVVSPKKANAGDQKR